MICDVCKRESERNYGAILSDRGFVMGHKPCVMALQSKGPDYVMRFLWPDGAKGSYTAGWLKDVESRKVVRGGEVIRNTNRRYFT